MELKDQRVMTRRSYGTDYILRSFVGFSIRHAERYQTYLLSPVSSKTSLRVYPILQEDALGSSCQTFLSIGCVGAVLARCFPEVRDYQIFRVHFDTFRDPRIYPPENLYGTTLAEWRDTLFCGTPVVQRLGWETLRGSTNNYTHASSLVEQFQKNMANDLMFLPSISCVPSAAERESLCLSDTPHPGLCLQAEDYFDLDMLVHEERSTAQKETPLVQ